MSETHRIYLRAGKYLPQFLYKGQWRCYENRFEQDIGFGSEELARVYLRQKVQQVVDENKDRVAKAQAQLDIRQAQLDAIDSAPLVPWEEPKSPWSQPK